MTLETLDILLRATYQSLQVPVRVSLKWETLYQHTLSWPKAPSAFGGRRLDRVKTLSVRLLSYLRLIHYSHYFQYL